MAVKMPLPPGRARAFEATRKQGCDCVAEVLQTRGWFQQKSGAIYLFQ